MIDLIYLFDFGIFAVNATGLFFTIIKNYNLPLTNRHIARILAYFLFTFYIGLDFLFDHSLNVVDAFLFSDLYSQLLFLGKRFILLLFTCVAIPLGNDSKFWQK